MIGSVHGRHAVPLSTPYPAYRAWRIYRTARFWIQLKSNNGRFRIGYYIGHHPVVHLYALVSLIGTFYVLAAYFSH